MSASPGDIIRIRMGVNADNNTAIAYDNRVVGTYIGPVKNFTYDIQSPQFVEEIVEGAIPSVGHSLVWGTTVPMPDPIAVEFKQFVRESDDGRGILSFTEWACKNCDGVILRKIREIYRTKYDKNIVFDADSMFWIMDRCKLLEDRLERISKII